MAREGRKSVYLEAKAVDDLKGLISEGFIYHGIKLSNMSQVITALVADYKTK